MSDQKSKVAEIVYDREKFGWPKAVTNLKAPENAKAPVWKYFGAGTCGKTNKDASFCKLCEKKGEENLASEFERYRNYVDPGINAASFDLLVWWRANAACFPILARV